MTEIEPLDDATVAELRSRLSAQAGRAVVPPDLAAGVARRHRDLVRRRAATRLVGVGVACLLVAGGVFAVARLRQSDPVSEVAADGGPDPSVVAARRPPVADCADALPAPAAGTDTAVPADADTAVPADADSSVPAGTDTAVPADADTAVPADADSSVPPGADTAVPAGADTAVPAGADTAVPAGADTAVPSRADAILWLDVTLEDADLARIEAELAASPQVAGFRYVDRGETYDEFVRYFADQPEVIDLVEPEQLPTSFRIDSNDPASLQWLGDLPGVDQLELADPGCDGTED